MQKITSCIFLLLTLLSCNTQTKKTDNTTQTLQESSKTSIVDTAKKLTKELFTLIDRADKKEISKKQLDKVVKPLKKRIDSIRINLTDAERKDVEQYGKELFNELVNKKVLRDN